MSHNRDHIIIQQLKVVFAAPEVREGLREAQCTRIDTILAKPFEQITRGDKLYLCDVHRRLLLTRST